MTEGTIYHINEQSIRKGVDAMNARLQQINMLYNETTHLLGAPMTKDQREQWEKQPFNYTLNRLTDGVKIEGVPNMSPQQKLDLLQIDVSVLHTLSKGITTITGVRWFKNKYIIKKGEVAKIRETFTSRCTDKSQEDKLRIINGFRDAASDIAKVIPRIHLQNLARNSAGVFKYDSVSGQLNVSPTQMQFIMQS